MARAFVFPGQGSQAVGMGKALSDSFTPARLVLEEVDEALGQHLSRLMAEGPEQDLTLTENAQPALMAVSMAVVRVLENETGRSLSDLCSLVAGHSLGEYSALTAASSLSLSDTARLLRRRGQAMQQAVPVGEGAMAALLGLEIETVTEVAAAAAEQAGAGRICTLANDNSSGQVVVSGHRDAVEKAVALAAEKGGKRSVLLPVSAPFHCPLMAPAADAMAEALAAVTLATPLIPVIANVTAEPVTEPDTIRRLLVDQVTAPVRWRESMLRARQEGIETIAELGAGKVLSGLMRRIDKAVSASPIGTPEDVDAFLKSL